MRPDEKRPTLRDSAGRYLPGTRPGPGLPKGYGAWKRIAAAMLTEECSLQQAVRDVFLDLTKRTLRGDRTARRALLLFVGQCRGENDLLALFTKSWAEDAARISKALDL